MRYINFLNITDALSLCLRLRSIITSPSILLFRAHPLTFKYISLPLYKSYTLANSLNFFFPSLSLANYALCLALSILYTLVSHEKSLIAPGVSACPLSFAIITILPLRYIAHHRFYLPAILAATNGPEVETDRWRRGEARKKRAHAHPH